MRRLGRPRSLGVRVGLAAAGAILLALAALAVVLALLVARERHRSLDQQLRQRAGEVARLSATAPALLNRPGSLDSPLGGRQLLVQVVDRRGRTVARSQALEGRSLPAGQLLAAALGGPRSGYADGSNGDEHLRVFVAPLADIGGPAGGGAVVVGGATGELDATLSRLRSVGLVAVLVTAALGALLAALLARRALRPLERLSSAAADIERTGDARRRLPEPATADELARLGDTLNRMLAALEHARDAERRFVGDASHELRTPLTALRGNAAYVARHGADPAALDDLEADAARLSALLDDLLALAREDAAAPVHGEPVDLAELAADAVEADPRATAAGDRASVLGERPALERAVGNLVRNARRHGPPDGLITVTTELDGDRARIAVADEGPGLSREQAAHAFERFWRAPGAHGEGSGLGLAIVRAIAERHGGSVTVDGARFTIELPALTDLSTGARRNGPHETTSPRD
jgi:signal transduction histidine kinase